MYLQADITDEEEEQINEFQHSTDSYPDVLISKNLLPPALDPLPRLDHNYPNSLLPMIPLPEFVGIIPEHQPLNLLPAPDSAINTLKPVWIATAFDHIVYKRYHEDNYNLQEDREEAWNVWTCDVSKIGERGDPHQNQKQKLLTPYYTPQNSEDSTLVFESRFESGNLSMAGKVSPTEYNLLLQNDINTTGYTQWFFFRVSNTRQKSSVKFNILNVYKNNSLYQAGMKVIVYSCKKSEQSNLSWHRDGRDISYFENIYSKSPRSTRHFYTLTWTYDFEYDEDEVYFAYNYPYTYSNLDALLRSIETDPDNSKIFKRGLLCKTFAGNRVDLVTITEMKKHQSIKKEVIIISARVHPGETVSSFVFEGILKYLLSAEASLLRRHFIFKMIPMINPDGVIHGNYRTNLSGKDMNRYWEDPSKFLIPEIYFFKKFIMQLHEEHGVALFCDLHGHSKKKNSFVYGCHNPRRPFEGKEFPFLISKLFEGFSFKCCSFLKKDVREGSSRSVLSRELRIGDVFTLENSFCGPSYEDIHFTVKHFNDLGCRFGEALILYFKPVIKQKVLQYNVKNKTGTVIEDVFSEGDDQQRSHHLDELYKNKSVLLEKVNSENSQGSDQEVEEENIFVEGNIEYQHERSPAREPGRMSQSLRTRSMITTKIKLTITNKPPPILLKRTRKRSEDIPTVSTSGPRISQKKKSQLLRKSSQKLEVFRQVELKLYEADQFLGGSFAPGNNLDVRRLSIPQRKIVRKSFSPVKQHQKKSIELKTESPGISFNILKNNYFSVLLNPQPAPDEPMLRELLQPKQFRGLCSPERMSSEFRVRKKMLSSSDRLRVAKDVVEDLNVYKNVMNSLKVLRR